MAAVHRSRSGGPVTDRLHALQAAGVSIWLDTLSRELLDTGEFARLVDRCHVRGATSNPTIFAKAITSSDRYDMQLKRLLATGVGDTRELFFALALEDVGRAADILMPVHERTAGHDGYVSIECTPDLADDTDATVIRSKTSRCVEKSRTMWCMYGMRTRSDRPGEPVKRMTGERSA